MNARPIKSLKGNIYEIEQSVFFHYFLRVFTAHISSFIYRRSIMSEARFENSLRSAGEDYVFMLQIITSARKVCFSNNIGVTCGEGINIYYGTYRWDDEGHLRRIMGDIISLYELKLALRLSHNDLKFINSKMRMTKRRFAFFATRWLVKYRRKWSPELQSLAKADATLWFWLPAMACYVVLLYPLNLYSPLTDVKE